MDSMLTMIQNRERNHLTPYLERNGVRHDQEAIALVHVGDESTSLSTNT